MYTYTKLLIKDHDYLVKSGLETISNQAGKLRIQTPRKLYNNAIFLQIENDWLATVKRCFKLKKAMKAFLRNFDFKHIEVSNRPFHVNDICQHFI